MYEVINNRIFWIYLIITIFFIIIGIRFLIISNDNNVIIVTILWLMATILLMIMIIHTSTDEDISIIDNKCFDIDKRSWLFTNFLFIFLLIISSFWAGEFSNNDEDSIKTMAGILLLLGGLLMCLFIVNKFNNFIYHGIFWISISYILIWLVLTLYVTI